MELGWYFWVLAAVVAFAWWYTKVEENKTWALWTWNMIQKMWEWTWTRLMSHLGESPYTYRNRHGGHDAS